MDGYVLQDLWWKEGVCHESLITTRFPSNMTAVTWFCLLVSCPDVPTKNKNVRYILTTARLLIGFEDSLFNMT